VHSARASARWGGGARTFRRTFAERRGWRTVLLARHASGEVGLAPGFDRLSHRLCHEHRVLRRGNRGVHEHAVATQLHRNGGIARRAHTRVHQDRHRGLLDDETDIVRIADAQPRTDRRRQRHHRHTAHLGKAPRHDRIVIGVHHDFETVLDQRLGSGQGLGDIRVQGFFTAQHLELHKIVPVEQFTREPAGTHRVFGAVATRGIRKIGIFQRRQYIEQTRLVGILADIGAPHRDGDDLRTARFHGAPGFLEILVLAGTHQQSRRVGRPAITSGSAASGLTGAFAVVWFFCTGLLSSAASDREHRFHAMGPELEFAISAARLGTVRFRPRRRPCSYRAARRP
jgi:hypothetical protein